MSRYDQQLFEPSAHRDKEERDIVLDQNSAPHTPTESSRSADSGERLEGLHLTTRDNMIGSCRGMACRAMSRLAVRTGKASQSNFGMCLLMVTQVELDVPGKQSDWVNQTSL